MTIVAAVLLRLLTGMVTSVNTPWQNTMRLTRWKIWDHRTQSMLSKSPPTQLLVSNSCYHSTPLFCRSSIKKEHQWLDWLHLDIATDVHMNCFAWELFVVICVFSKLKKTVSVFDTKIHRRMGNNLSVKKKKIQYTTLNRPYIQLWTGNNIVTDPKFSYSGKIRYSQIGTMRTPLVYIHNSEHETTATLYCWQRNDKDVLNSRVSLKMLPKWQCGS